MSFTIFQNKKKPVLAIETGSSKGRKIDIFPKGLNNGFCPKVAIYLMFFFQALQARKMSFTIFYNQKTPFQAIKTRSLRSRKIDIFAVGLTHGFSPKMAIFPNFFFQAVQGRKMPFTMSQNKKKPFQAIKTKSLKSRKIATFPKGLTHRFGTKMAIFPNSFFQAIQARKMSFTIFQNKNSLSRLKNKRLKKSKN